MEEESVFLRRELELETELELDFFFPLLEPVELRKSEEERPPPIKALNMMIAVDVVDCWGQGKMRSERSCPSERGDHDHVGFFLFCDWILQLVVMVVRWWYVFSGEWNVR